MAYNSNLYNQQYGQATIPAYANVIPAQQPYNGLIRVNDVDEAIQKSSFMPVNSVSNPYFLPDGQTFVVVFKDANGNVTVKHNTYHDSTPDPMANFVTKDDFAAAIAEIKEAINGEPTTDGTAGNTETGKQ